MENVCPGSVGSVGSCGDLWVWVFVGSVGICGFLSLEGCSSRLSFGCCCGVCRVLWGSVEF